MTKFAIFAGARTGSSTLYEFFKDIGMHIRFEPFRPSKWEHLYDIEGELKGMYARLDGIKHLHDHVSMNENRVILEWLVENEVLIIYLSRRNKIFQAISRELAFQTGYWGTIPPSLERALAYLALEFLPLDIQKMRNDIADLEREETFYRTFTARQAMFFHYEELFSPEIEENRKHVHFMLSFLGMRPGELEEWMIKEHFSRSNKRNTLNVYRRIPNWNEIRQEFNIDEEELS